METVYLATRLLILKMYRDIDLFIHSIHGTLFNHLLTFELLEEDYSPRRKRNKRAPLAWDRATLPPIRNKLRTAL